MAIGEPLGGVEGIKIYDDSIAQDVHGVLSHNSGRQQV